jgi:hypothetical protein
MNKLLVSAALVGGLSLSGLGLAAPAHAGVKVGTLSCREAGGWGYILGSSRALDCTFTGADHSEHYRGSMSKFGVDIGYQHSAVMIWEVIAPNDHPSRGALAGHYGGATASAAVGVGLGANVLIGGFDRSFALQPLSVKGSTGVNVAAGIGELTLRS